MSYQLIILFYYMKYGEIKQKMKHTKPISKYGGKSDLQTKRQCQTGVLFGSLLRS
jgi:hypothetical protein